MNETKKWIVEYRHADGRSGSVKAETEISKSGCFDYGNGKAGALYIDGSPTTYDLRYVNEDDLHRVMIKEYFGKGLVNATELSEI